MSLLANNHSKLDLIGNADPVCPQCSSRFEKMPAKKKKCPHCGNFVYVRTRPFDRKKVLLSKEQVDQIESLWMMINDTLRLHPLGTHDTFWSQCNQELLQHAQNSDWGLFRNTRLNMAQLLTGERRYREALTTFIEVSYLDANGPNNLGGITDPTIIRQFPPFNPKDAFQAPGIVSLISTLAKWLDLGATDLEQDYVKVADAMHKRMKLPVSPVDGWHDFQIELAKSQG